MQEIKIQKGDVVRLLEPYQDKGDDELIWVAIEDEEKGQVTAMPINPTHPMQSLYVMNVDRLRLVRRSSE